jgi:carbon monoxide dehydrogenase subunit G
MESLKILIPTDFTVQAEYAYLMVKKLEEKIQVRTHFLHVLQVPDTVTMDADGNIQTCGEIDVNYVLKQKEENWPVSRLCMAGTSKPILFLEKQPMQY